TILIPAPNGLGAPHWLPDARTALFGPGPSTTQADLIRAAVEGIAFLMKDIVEAMRGTDRIRIDSLSAAGGGSRVNALIQAQADCLGIPIRRSSSFEATGLGAALLAGVGCGWWPSPPETVHATEGRVFRPRISKAERDRRYSRWKRAIEAVRKFYGE
ncbi:MAG TPA: FGGY-family carbohydrate kinase, partial [Nitrospiria bacterium]